MDPNRQEITLFNAVTPIAISGSTNATPSVITTSSAHGYTTGQRVLIFGHATNTAINGIFIAQVISPTTFSLTDEATGVAITANGVGTGGNTCVAPPVLNMIGFRNWIIQLGTTGTSTATFKAFGSMGIPGNPQTPRRDLPNFGATIAPTNPYSALQIIPLDTDTAVAGGTGIVVAGADVNNMWEVNTNLIKYGTVLPTSWTQGAFTIKAVIDTNA